ncbi:hypothetical protein PVAP13_6NG001732 [Panicum virgatum]|uniref:Uncharacterized protein n=1 Tax=Panicum virgatum TaxID=38727 RepID=A0A8T0R4Y4_PANVG|nr:hypothetical protein PVAP13_6NG001732 [Panicum virgatum]
MMSLCFFFLPHIVASASIPIYMDEFSFFFPCSSSSYDMPPISKLYCLAGQLNFYVIHHWRNEPCICILRKTYIHDLINGIYMIVSFFAATLILVSLFYL